MNVVIRNVDRKAYKDLKMACVQMGITLGRAASEAFEHWAKKAGRTEGKRPSIFDFKPVRLGKGTESGSLKIDELAFRD